MIKVCTTYTLDDLPLGTKGRVMALGLFDGVHMGHLDIIGKAVSVAERDGLTSTVQTFKNLYKSDDRYLYTPQERLKLIGDTGADELLVLDFDAVKEIAGWITPVPGGVGKMTITMLLSNTADAAERTLA